MERRRRLSYANVASTLALVLALSGTAYAAATVTSGDIVNGTIKVKDISSGAVTDLLPEGAYGFDDDAGVFSGTGLQVIATLEVPDDADLVVFAKMRVNNEGGAGLAFCRLDGGSAADINFGTLTAVGTSGSTENMAFTVANFFRSTDDVTVSCSANGGTMHAFDLKITAFETGSVTETAL